MKCKIKSICKVILYAQQVCRDVYLYRGMRHSSNWQAEVRFHPILKKNK